MGNTQSKDDGGGGGGGGGGGLADSMAGDSSRLKRFHTGASTDSSGFQSVAHPSLRRLSTTATGSARHEQRRPSQASQGSGNDSGKSDTTPSASTFLRAASNERRSSASAGNSPRATDREQHWVRNTALSGAGGDSGDGSGSRTPTSSPNRQRTRSESLSRFLSGGSGGVGGSGARRQPVPLTGTTSTPTNMRSEFTFRRKKSIELSDMEQSLTFSGHAQASGLAPERQSSQDSTSLLSPLTDASTNSASSPPSGSRFRQISNSVDDDSSNERSQQDSTTVGDYNPLFPFNFDGGGGGGGRSQSSADPLGRKQPTALPSYLKIPTLIPSAYASPTSSIPSSPSGVERRSSIDVIEGDETASIISSAPSATASTMHGGAPRLAGLGGIAAAAVLNTQDVVLAPGEASKVSSPYSEDPDSSQETESGKGAGGVFGAPGHATDSSTTMTSDTSESRVAASSRNTTPTPGAMAGGHAMTPTEGTSASALSTLSPTAAETGDVNAQDYGFGRRPSVQLYTGSESGHATPALPIGLTSAPSSAFTPAIPTYGADGQPSGPSTPLTKETNNLKLTLPETITPASATPTPTATSHHGTTGAGTTASSLSSSTGTLHARGASMTPTGNRMSMTAAKQPVPLLPIVVKWRGGGKEVFVTGTFANEWRSKILLRKSATSTGKRSEYSCVLHLAPGTHRLKFIVDDRWRVSRDLSTASDGEGNLTNYIEVAHQGPAHPGPLSAPGEDLLPAPEDDEEKRKRPGGLGGHKAVLDLLEEARRAEALRRGDLLDVFGEDKVRPEERWTQDVPPSIIKAQASEEQHRNDMEALAEQEQRSGKHHHRNASSGGSSAGDRDASPPSVVPAPPALPRQLEKVILNSTSAAVLGTVDDNSVLPAPNHAVLHHLTASAIKSGVIATGCTVRYRKKYITTVYYRAAN